MKQITWAVRSLAAGMIACAAGAANSYEYEYGVIPMTSNLCSKTAFAATVSPKLYLSGDVKGEAGGGWWEAIYADATGWAALAGSMEMSAASSAEISSANCVPLIDTKTELDFGDLNEIEQYAKRVLLMDGSGDPIDESELALAMISHATNFNAHLGASRGMLSSFGTINQRFTDAITSADPLNMPRNIRTIAQLNESFYEMLPAQMRDAVSDPEQIVLNHIKQLDFIRTNCADLANGEIQHLPDEAIASLEEICITALDTQIALEGFLTSMYGAVVAGGETVGKMATVVASGETVKATGDSLKNTASEIESTVAAVIDSTSALGETVQQSSELLTASVSATGNVISGTVGTIQNTATQLSSGLSDVSSGASGNMTLLQDEAEKTAELIEGLSLTAVASLPGKILQERTEAAAAAVASVADSLCNAEVSIGFGSVSLSSFGVVSSILGCD